MSSTAEAAPATLDPLEAEVVQYFVRLAQALGLPRSIGEIYGVAFCAREPISLDDVAAKLQISRGSASQGLRVLLKLGALTTPYVARERKTLYVIEPSLRKVVDNLLTQTVRPFLQDSDEQLRHIRALAKERGPETEAFIGQRLESLSTWSRLAQRLLPWITRLATREKWWPKR